MQCTHLVTKRIAQIGEIELAEGALPPAGRVLDALAPVGDTGMVSVTSPSEALITRNPIPLTIGATLVSRAS
jgi:hypothetical protein